MNKKGFLFSFLFFIFSFFFISNVSAGSLNGYTVNQDFLDRGWTAVLEGRTSNGRVFHQQDFPLAFCNDSGSTINCTFLPDYQYRGTLSMGIVLDSSVTSTYLYAPSFSFNTSNNTFSYRSVNNFTFFTASYYYIRDINFDIYDGTTKKWSKNLTYSVAPQNYVINFHLNDSEVFDTSDIMNPELINQDFSVSLTSDELHDYITHLTFMKTSSDFIGLYYDSSFTQPYSSNDTINSDIDLYAKFEPKFININNIDYIEFKFDDLPLTSTNISYDFHLNQY